MTTLLLLCGFFLPSFAQLPLPELEQQDCSLQCLSWCPEQSEPVIKHINETVILTSTQVATTTKTQYVTLQETEIDYVTSMITDRTTVLQTEIDYITSTVTDRTTVVQTNHITNWTTITLTDYTLCNNSHLAKRTAYPTDPVIDNSLITTPQFVDQIQPSATTFPTDYTDDYDGEEILPNFYMDQLLSNAKDLDDLFLMVNSTLKMLDQNKANVTTKESLIETNTQLDWTKDPFLLIRLYPDLTGIQYCV